MKLLNHWKSLSLLALAGMLLAGCGANSVAARKQERLAAYEALSPEMRSLVDQGNITRGLDTNAVYIAWGPPAQVTQGENDLGETTTWSYYGTFTQQTTYWGWRHVYYGYNPVNFISGQVTFTNGYVKQWQTYPAPGY
ncbi:MAG TPA: hypothetical protein VN048_07990 [Verrucomicrobiae bacterium]|jgi:hypothetical protein|nr:hypothetical protein [Verrucomicrobiae bacterium]